MAGFGSFQGVGSVGTDLSLTITRNDTGDNVVLDGPRVRFDEEDDSHLHKGSPSDSPFPWHRVTPNGWHGSIEVERFSSDFESLYAFLEAAYANGAPQTTFSITVTKLNTGGSAIGTTKRFQHIGCVFHGYKPGTWERENITKPSVSFASSTRVEL